MGSFSKVSHHHSSVQFNSVFASENLLIKSAMSLLCLLTVVAGGILRLADSCSPRPVDGSWGSWTDWTSCSQSCGGGTEMRGRLCDSPAPAHGGADCQGDGLEQRQCPVPGFLISGGWSDSSAKKVELYNPASGNSCPVQDLQQYRLGHSSCGGLLCGGGWYSSSYQSCERITGTEVSPLPSLTLRQRREYHLCWSLPADKVMLLGGGYRPAANTTEIVSGSSSSEGFTLPYRTHSACGIEVRDHYIVTGGYDYDAPEEALKTVAKYSQSGLVDYLPSLNQRRFQHACSSFISDSGETVLMVTGGAHWLGGTKTRLDSTEILVVTPGRSWRTLTTARLPSPRDRLRAGTSNNVVFVFGGYDGSSYFNSILSFNKTEESWQPAGQMNVERSGHAVEKIKDVGQYCP